MIQTETTYLCEICGESSRMPPLGGVTYEEPMALPIITCPYCGPVNWEVMQICREQVVRNFLN